MPLIYVTYIGLIQRVGTLNSRMMKRVVIVQIRNPFSAHSFSTPIALMITCDTLWAYKDNQHIMLIFLLLNYNSC